MATFVGTQDEFQDALYELCELDYDAIEAYQAAINRIDLMQYKESLTEFKMDHQRHVDEITMILKKHQCDAPDGPSVKEYLTQGKVVLANMFGDKAILHAMLTNEEDTNQAYDRINNHQHKWADSEDILRRAWADEKRHKAWLEMTIKHLD